MCFIPSKFKFELAEITFMDRNQKGMNLE